MPPPIVSASPSFFALHLRLPASAPRRAHSPDSKKKVRISTFFVLSAKPPPATPRTAAFRAKIAARYRGGFLSEVPNFAGGLEGAEAQSETIVDAQIGYTFNREGSALNGVQVLAEVFNLTNEPFVTQNELFSATGASLGTSYPSRHEIYGRTFQFTLRKSF